MLCGLICKHALCEINFFKAWDGSQLNKIYVCSWDISVIITLAPQILLFQLRYDLAITWLSTVTDLKRVQ